MKWMNSTILIAAAKDSFDPEPHSDQYVHQPLLPEAAFFMSKIMTFPMITCFQDVWAQVEKNEAITRTQKDGYVVLDYDSIMAESFDTPVALECRGLKFAEDGTLLARPFHKFFNPYEKERPEDIDWSVSYRVLSKLDGSMVHPCLLDGEVVFMTRAGVTRHADHAKSFATDRMTDVCGALLRDGITPIFEFTSPENQIVISYDETQLTLLAARHNVSGAYLSWPQLEDLASQMDTPLVETIDLDLGQSGPEFLEAIAKIRDIVDIEGYVVVFETGHRLKLKTNSYALRHKAISSFRNEANVLSWVVEGVVDDVLPIMRADRADMLRVYQRTILNSVDILSKQLEAFYVEHEGLDRKSYALAVKSKLPKKLLGAAFARLGGKDAKAAIFGVLDHARQKESRVDEIRDLFGMNWEPDLEVIEQ